MAPEAIAVSDWLLVHCWYDTTKFWLWQPSFHFSKHVSFQQMQKVHVHFNKMQKYIRRTPQFMKSTPYIYYTLRKFPLCIYYIVTVTNFTMKRIAIHVTTISFFVYLPVKSEIRTYVMAPRPIPFEIE